MPTIIRCLMLEHRRSFYKRIPKETALTLIQQRRTVVVTEKLDADPMRCIVSDNVTGVDDVAFVIIVDKQIEVACI